MPNVLKQKAVSLLLLFGMIGMSSAHVHVQARPQSCSQVLAQSGPVATTAAASAGQRFATG